MPPQPDGDDPSDEARTRAETVHRRRPLLQVGGVTALSLSLAGCLSQSVEARAVPLGISPADASEAGYESEPRTEEYAVEREQNVGPATIKAEVVSTIVEYVYTGSANENDTEGVNDLAYGSVAQGSQETGHGILTLMSTPEVERFGQSFNQFTKLAVPELVREFPKVFQQVCDCRVDGSQTTVERVSNPAETTARPDENTVYVAPGNGGSGWTPPSNASFLDRDIAEADLTALYIPTVEDGTVTAYYLVGTREFVGHEPSDGNRQFAIAAYTARREAPELSPDGAVPLLGSGGFFEAEAIRDYNERFSVVLRVPVNAANETV